MEKIPAYEAAVEALRDLLEVAEVPRIRLPLDSPRIRKAREALRRLQEQQR